jgi:hypothetical protein
VALLSRYIFRIFFSLVDALIIPDQFLRKMPSETKNPAPIATVVVIGAGFGASAVQMTKWAHTRQIGLLLFAINEVICRALTVTICRGIYTNCIWGVKYKYCISRRRLLAPVGLVATPGPHIPTNGEDEAPLTGLGQANQPPVPLRKKVWYCINNSSILGETGQ